ncbi:copper homeostasis protein CutC [Wenjunlia tyrosinilytica]|nr:copper homeostasis protein CutC [Wenjunlia tyrosinilytica]
MSRPIFEVIAVSADDAVAAQAGGADRLELVTDMAADGLTPPRELFARIRAAVDLPLRVMLRLQDGFAAGDTDRLCATAEELRAEGAEEFVLGFLGPDGGLDLDSVRAVTGAVPGCRWTFHRAIDHSADRDWLRSQLEGYPGLDTFLTAGSARGVDDGLATLLAEAAASDSGAPGHEPRLLVGGGLRLDHLPVLRAAGIDAFHVGGAVRQGGWSGAVDPALVREWRSLLDAPAVPV